MIYEIIGKFVILIEIVVFSLFFYKMYKDIKKIDSN